MHDIRLGGLERRLKSCELDLQDYVSGKILRIKELETPLLDYNGGEKKLLNVNGWWNIVSPNVLLGKIERNAFCFEHKST